MMSLDLKDNDFKKIVRLVYEQCGINLHDGKRELVKARLSKRLRETGFTSFADYCRYVVSEKGGCELTSMIDSISTNMTYFFREDVHFQKLRTIIPAMTQEKGHNGHTPKLRIWTAGCSTGEEPYSLAITLKEHSSTIEATILATDISSKVLKTATNGIYLNQKLKNILPGILKKYFQYGCGEWAGYYRVKDEVRRMIQFMKFNLMDPPPPDFLFDIIFCRNVMIYFDKTTQGLLVNRFYNCLKDGGYFFVGHAESLSGISHPFKYIEPSIYRKHS
ncbi:MAG: protein-glutamate O-methyltransferase [Desulfobacterales bacterium]|nr:protein-glutamate O-methyltransferase [Desulfobacterales bacterium]